MLQFFRDFKKYSRLLNISFLKFTEIMKQCEDDFKIPKDVAFKIIETRTDDLHELVKNGDRENSATKEYSREGRFALAILQIYNHPPLGGWEWDR